MQKEPCDLKIWLFEWICQYTFEAQKYRANTLVVYGSFHSDERWYWASTDKSNPMVLFVVDSQYMLSVQIYALDFLARGL